MCLKVKGIKWILKDGNIKNEFRCKIHFLHSLKHSFAIWNFGHFFIRHIEHIFEEFCKIFSAVASFTI